MSFEHDLDRHNARLPERPMFPVPERTAVWTELAAAGVDHINTDDLAGLAEFLRSGPRRST